MNIIDISWPIDPSITAYKDKKVVAFEYPKIFERDSVRESVMQLGAHTGTHIDAPAHFMQTGHTIDKNDLASTIGPCKVLDLTNVSEYVGSDDLAMQSINEGDIVLLKTSNSALGTNQPFNSKFVNLAESGARLLAERKIKAVGIDYLGIGSHESHIALMSHGITIIEGIRLGHVHPGHYFLVCLPLAVIGLEAAPARAILLEK